MKYLTKQQVLQLHQQLLEAFGGAVGLRDEGLLEGMLPGGRILFYRCFHTHASLLGDRGGISLLLRQE